MKTKKQKLIIVVGPTASGKTGLSIALAKKYGGEVISADSRQVYKELDIGTEKVTKREMENVPHYCIDIASPKRAFTVEQWRRHARKALHTIASHGKFPIVAGGTGFYIDSLVYEYSFPVVKPNAKLRNELAKKTAKELFEALQRLDPRRALTIENKNPRRLIRALEIAVDLGKVPTLKKKESSYNPVWIGINPGIDVLTERIESRFDSTIRRGLVGETKRLHEKLGLSWKRINELGLEYRIVGEYIRGEITKNEMKEKNIRELRKYAKRQMTWLKRTPEIQWFTNKEEALKKIDFKMLLNS
jgi:tRNA dimethylallyltransferase